MPEDHQNERRGGEVETETGERLKGPKPANLSQGKKVLSKARRVKTARRTNPSVRSRI